jgi:hypothetical protein
MTDRQVRQFKERGIDIGEIIQNAYDILNNMKNSGRTLEEAKLIITNMGCILERSEKYSPNTPLSNIPLEKTDN